MEEKMHYYKRNIGDYAKKAGRLSILQHGSYTLLIDACYDREKFPTLEEAIEWTWASTAEEIEAVTFVLKKFFTLEDGIYVQKRIKEEIAEYHGKSETNRRIAVDREAKRAENRTKREPIVNEAPPNQEPITNNQEPEEKVNPIVPAKAVTASGEAQLVFAYWQQKRGYQRAKLDAKRLKAINARLKDGYSVEDLCKAIDGIAKSRHHMGENDNRKIYDDIELICRDGPKVDGFIKLADAAPGFSPRLQNQIDVLNDWMNKP